MKCAEVRHISAQAIMSRKCAGATCSPPVSRQWFIACRGTSCSNGDRRRCTSAFRGLGPFLTSRGSSQQRGAIRRDAACDTEPGRHQNRQDPQQRQRRTNHAASGIWHVAITPGEGRVHLRMGKQHGTMRKTKHRGIGRVVADFLLNLIAYNLIRIPKLLAA